MPTPAISYLTRAFIKVDLRDAISASHNPYYDNGIKFFSAEGTKLPDDVELEIEKALEEEMVLADRQTLAEPTDRMMHQAAMLNSAEAPLPPIYPLTVLRLS